MFHRQSFRSFCSEFFLSTCVKLTLEFNGVFVFFLSSAVPHQPGVRKYVIWCLICGGILCLLGVMFLAVYFLLRSYTSTVGYFETVPPFVPATLVSNHLYYFYLKVCGIFGKVLFTAHSFVFESRYIKQKKGVKTKIEALNLIFTTH